MQNLIVSIDLSSRERLGHPLSVSVLLVITLVAAQGQTWGPSAAPSNSWTAITCSADGSNVLAASTQNYTNGQIYLSRDAGASWVVTAAPAGPWSVVTCSADGVNLAAVLGTAIGKLYTSTNSGMTWQSPSQAPEVGPWVGSLASSRDGRALITVNGTDGVFFSTNGGAAWTSRRTGIYDVAQVVCSADGTKVAVDNNAFGITVSTNGGGNWTAPVIVGGGGSLQASGDLGTLLATVSQAPRLEVITSTNRGITWMTNSLPATNWTGLATSVDGNRFVAVAAGGLIYSSANAGATWFSNSAPPLKWQATASSADGGVVFAAAAGGGIWMRRTTPAPLLKIALSRTEPSLSWTVPSSPLVLQQTPSLAAPWITVSNSPTLNLSDLSYRLVPPLLGNTTFYRLRTP